MVFLVLLIPLGVMLFALMMGRIEHRLKGRIVSEAEVQEFVEQARPDEVDTVIREGFSRAWRKFRRRRRDNRPSRRTRLFSRRSDTT